MLNTFLGHLVPPSITSARPPAAGGCRRNDTAERYRGSGGAGKGRRRSAREGPRRVPRSAGQTGPAAPGWGARSTVGQAAGTGRPGGGSAANPSAAKSRRTAWGSVTAPRIRRGPAQRSHTSTSTPNITTARLGPLPMLPPTTASAPPGSAGTDGKTRRRRGAAVCYRMTSSARRSIDCGIVSPSAFAVFKLISSSNLVGCSTGRSPGLAPFRILST